ncbi:MAG TPA: hypothetical protein PLS62_11200 [Desulfobacteraceae bacterium]|nr:hypothetical protein [Desulfobacteraceae bacterium]
MWQTTNIRHPEYKGELGELELTKLNNNGVFTKTRIVLPLRIPGDTEYVQYSNRELSTLLFDLAYALEPEVVDDYLENDMAEPTIISN